ncbi:MAG: DNA polymerase I [Endomicrobium sp.]|jgi:DNA polymerase-1|nr:DNA polymerase I [Endomicrobium sp.]
MKTFYIIDGNAYIHRAYHALPPLSVSDGRQVNAVFGFVKLLLKIRETFKPDYLAVCFDYPAKNFRHYIDKEYKAHRKPLDEALISQMPAAKDAAQALNIYKTEIEGYEADDLIASFISRNKKENIQTVVVTGDKDILQLVENENVLVWNDSKDVLFDEQKVEEKFGVPPKKLLDIFSLMGDAADNISGIKGIGEKTAVKLIKEFGSLENVLENAASVKGKIGGLLQNGKEDALKSKKLIELDAAVPINYDLEKYAVMPLDEKAKPFFKEYEFNSLLNKYFSEGLQSVSETDTDVKKAEAFACAVIDTIDGAKRLLKEIDEAKDVAFAIIGSSQDALKAKIVGASFHVNAKSYYIPTGHNDFTALQITPDDFKEIFAGVFSSKEIKKTGYDLKTAINILKTSGFMACGIHFDVMLASYCINPAKPHGISEMSAQYLNFSAADESFLGKGAKKVSFENCSVQQAALYANSLTYAAFNLRGIFEKKIKSLNLGNLFFNVEMPLIEILSEMETAGIKIDAGFLKIFNEKIVSELKKTEEKAYASAGTEFNINSPKQLARIMFEKLNLPVIKKTKTGYSTDEEVLTELSSYEFAADILKYRELQKIKNTYIDPIGNYMSYYGGRIHTVFNQALTTTGRLSSSEPNLQNIPIKSAYGREFRKAFVPEKNKVFISADYSQIDLRALAHISGDEKLIQAFKDGQDIHCATAREVFGIPEGEPVAYDLRSAAKSINFGIVYGMSPFGLSRQLGISFGKAKEYIDGYFERYAGVKRWMKKVVADALRDGYVKTITGRIRYVAELKSSNVQARQAGERMALNTPIQGTSADIIKIAMINIYEDLQNSKEKAIMLLQVHDDLLFEADADFAPELKKLIKDKMENAIRLSVPLSVEVKEGKNWGQMV